MSENLDNHLNEAWKTLTAPGARYELAHILTDTGSSLNSPTKLFGKAERLNVRFTSRV